VAHGVFGEVAREGGSVLAGVPGGASCLAPSTIGFGEDAEVGAEVRSKSGAGSLYRERRERVVESDGESCSGLGSVWPKDAVEKGAELCAWIKSAW
jgi:hypothetical protein